MPDPRAEILRASVARIPYLEFLGIRLDTAGEELTVALPFRPELIGNPLIPALHGGVTGALLEITSIVGLIWAGLIEGCPAPPAATAAPVALPRTINLTVDYLRPGLARDSFARARVNRQGRRYASVGATCWQEDPARPFAQANGHFLMPAAC